MLDRLSLSIGEPLVPIIFARLPLMLNSENWKLRNAAVTTISLVGEGCADVLAENLGEVVNSILLGMRDPHERVRWAACNSLGQMCTDFHPTLQEEFHAEISQSLVMLMDDEANPRVQSHAASAVINLCDGTDPEVIVPHLPALLSKIAQLLKIHNVLILEQTVSAIAAVADCVKEAFTPVSLHLGKFF
jgi:importin-5